MRGWRSRGSREGVDGKKKERKGRVMGMGMGMILPARLLSLWCSLHTSFYSTTTVTATKSNA
jgi:hypothetical protein